MRSSNTVMIIRDVEAVDTVIEDKAALNIRRKAVEVATVMVMTTQTLLLKALTKTEVIEVAIEDKVLETQTLVAT